MIRFDILTIFPDQLNQFMEFGVFRIAKESSLLEYHVHDLRKWAENKHKNIDDRPYGGGAGMVIKVEPVFEALKKIRQDNSKVILFTPAGKVLDQTLVKELAGVGLETTEDKHYILLCGHYEGFDYRIHEHLTDLELSIGEYVLSGGEIPSLILMDSITRLVPGVLGNDLSSVEESFENGTLEHPHYTRPEEFNGWKVPDVLLSGNHAEIEKWRKSQSEKVI